jgi:hypothetical protein
MKQFTNILLVFASLALMLLVIWGFYLGVTFVINQFEFFDARETAIVTVSSLVVLMSSLIIATAIRSSIQKGDKKIQPVKAELYSSYMNAYDVLKNNPENFDAELIRMNRQMILWAGDDVLKEYGRLLNMLEKGDDKVYRQATNVLLEIRKDLGHKNRGVNIELISDSTISKSKSDSV